MTAILNFSEKKVLTSSLVFDFYTRRIKRIVPVYLVVMFLTFVLCSFYLFDADFSSFKTDATWSLFFISNIQSIFKQEGYFQQVWEYRFLLHTWSLSVEIQYYIIAPFLLFLIHRTGHQLETTCLVGSISWVFYNRYSSNETIAFGFVLSRLWQFLIGTGTFYCERKIDLKQLKNHTVINTASYLTVLYFLVSILLPHRYFLFQFSDTFKRLSVTILTGILIFLNMKNYSRLPKIVLNAIVFIGDISYSLYLIHWPIIVFAKYMLWNEKYCKYLY